MILNNKQLFGSCPDGEEAFLYTISNSSGTYAKISNFGGIIQSLAVKDKKGQLIDIAQGFGNAEDYHNNYKFIGVVIGRYANGIKDGVFKLNGKKYILNKN